jgi:hypothetical protein
LPNFLTYTDDDQRFIDDDQNFTIQYPENWVLRDEGYPNNGGLPNTEVLFDISGTSKEDEIFTLAPRWLMVNVEQVGSYFDNHTMTSKNQTLSGYCQALVYVINSDPSDTLIRQNQVTVGGNPGCRVEWKDGDSYNFEVYTIVDGKLFKLVYADHQLSVPETFPLANKIVESFQVNTAGEDRNNNSDFKGTSNISTFENYQNKYCPEPSDDPMLLVLCAPPRDPDE